MQQQIPQQEQYGTPQQMAQQMMLCPIQYVYESPMMVPQQPQDEQIQQNQIVFNVQNPPPWIQNRPQNQLVFLQQIPGNYQQYIQQQMVQTPVYQQLNYIQQPMIAQDTRQYMQISNVAPYNNVQNQTQIAAQQNNETERMPLLTQMLNQKIMANNVRVSQNATANNNNVTTGNVNVKPPNTQNIRATGANMIRPVMQNQQVQTDITANNRGRPKNVQPQIISINPMQQHQYINQKPDVMINIHSRPRAPYVREVPQHIRSKVPSSISVKTVYRPIHPRTIIRPYDVMPAPQNIYYSPNYVTLPNPEMRNSMTNTDNSYVSHNNNPQVQMPSAEVNVPVTKNIPADNNQNENDALRMQTANSGIATSNIKLENMKTYENDQINSNAIVNTGNKIQTEEKLIRNTVYVQARGRVLNENEVQTQNLKRTIDNRFDEGNVGKSPASNQNACSNNKYIKVETNETSKETDRIPVKALTANVPENFNSQQSKISSFPNISNKAKSEGSNTDQTLELEKTKPLLSVTNKKSDLNAKQDATWDLEQRIAANIMKASKDEKDRVLKRESEENKSVHKEETNLRNSKRMGNDINILTHVLDGYIIQESNVAFPIQRPTTEKENIVQYTSKNKDFETNKKMDSLGTENNEKVGTPLRDMEPITDLKGHTEVADKNKDDPFSNILKSTVESWTTGQLASHLANNDWKETAAKLHDEEIDGESLLLVNKEQLVAIGVCEKHAEAITAFAGAS